MRGRLDWVFRVILPIASETLWRPVDGLLTQRHRERYCCHPFSHVELAHAWDSLFSVWTQMESASMNAEWTTDTGSDAEVLIHSRWSLTCWLPNATSLQVRGKTNSKNIFHVRAIDQAGNVDPSPALYSWTLGADRSATGTQSSNTVPSYHPVDSHEDGDDSGNSSGSFPMMVVYIVAPIVGVVILAGLVVLIQRALLKRRLNRAQAYP